jgi:phosphatidylethanolamine-binding protein (PEBP) family uncharacterized protein
VPAGTRSLALVVDDPDAPGGVFTHWTAWGFDPAADGLREGEPAPGEGRNDFGTTGYRGPCPPPGHGRRREVMIDCGLDWRDAAPRLRSAAIVLTHAHPDHAAGVGRIYSVCPANQLDSVRG